jgi:hypothetical protein
MPIGELSTEDQAFFANRGAAPAASDAPPPVDGGHIGGPEKGEMPPAMDEAPEAPEEAPEEDAPKDPVSYEKWFQTRKEAERERKGRRRAEQELISLRERQAKAEGRLEALMARWGDETAAPAGRAPGQRAEAEPDRNVDYAGWLEWRMRQQDKVLGDLRQERDQRYQQSQQDAQVNQLKTVYQQAAQEFSAEQPDFDAAYRYIIDDRAKRLDALNYKPEEIARLINYEETGFVGRALQQGLNPAEELYKAAVKLGYKPGQRQAAEGVAAVAAGQRQRGVGGLPGGGGGSRSTLEALSKMDETEFDKFMANPRNWRKAHGA